jgi:hypothetical protein
VIEILAWTLVWPLAALLIDRLLSLRRPERRVARYPRAWRERHGDELAQLIEDAGTPWTITCARAQSAG